MDCPFLVIIAEKPSGTIWIKVHPLDLTSPPGWGTGHDNLVRRLFLQLMASLLRRYHTCCKPSMHPSSAGAAAAAGATATTARRTTSSSLASQLAAAAIAGAGIRGALGAGSGGAHLVGGGLHSFTHVGSVGTGGGGIGGLFSSFTRASSVSSASSGLRVMPGVPLLPSALNPGGGSGGPDHAFDVERFIKMHTESGGG